MSFFLENLVTGEFLSHEAKQGTEKNRTSSKTAFLELTKPDHLSDNSSIKSSVVCTTTSNETQVREKPSEKPIIVYCYQRLFLQYVFTKYRTPYIRDMESLAWQIGLPFQLVIAESLRMKALNQDSEESASNKINYCYLCNDVLFKFNGTCISSQEHFFSPKHLAILWNDIQQFQGKTTLHSQCKWEGIWLNIKNQSKYVRMKQYFEFKFSDNLLPEIFHQHEEDFLVSNNSQGYVKNEHDYTKICSCPAFPNQEELDKLAFGSKNAVKSKPCNCNMARTINSDLITLQPDFGNNEKFRQNHVYERGISNNEIHKNQDYNYTELNFSDDTLDTQNIVEISNEKCGSKSNENKSDKTHLNITTVSTPVKNKGLNSEQLRVKRVEIDNKNCTTKPKESQDNRRHSKMFNIPSERRKVSATKYANNMALLLDGHPMDNLPPVIDFTESGNKSTPEIKVEETWEEEETHTSMVIEPLEYDGFQIFPINKKIGVDDLCKKTNEKTNHERASKQKCRIFLHQFKKVVRRTVITKEIPRKSSDTHLLSRRKYKAAKRKHRLKRLHRELKKKIGAKKIKNIILGESDNDLNNVNDAFGGVVEIKVEDIRTSNVNKSFSNKSVTNPTLTEPRIKYPIREANSTKTSKGDCFEYEIELVEPKVEIDNDNADVCTEIDKDNTDNKVDAMDRVPDERNSCRDKLNSVAVKPGENITKGLNSSKPLKRKTISNNGILISDTKSNNYNKISVHTVDTGRNPGKSIITNTENTTEILEPKVEISESNNTLKINSAEINDMPVLIKEILPVAEGKMHDENLVMPILEKQVNLSGALSKSRGDINSLSERLFVNVQKCNMIIFNSKKYLDKFKRRRRLKKNDGKGKLTSIKRSLGRPRKINKLKYVPEENSLNKLEKKNKGKPLVNERRSRGRPRKTDKQKYLFKSKIIGKFESANQETKELVIKLKRVKNPIISLSENKKIQSSFLERRKALARYRTKPKSYICNKCKFQCTNKYLFKNHISWCEIKKTNFHEVKRLVVKLPKLDVSGYDLPLNLKEFKKDILEKTNIKEPRKELVINLVRLNKAFRMFKCKFCQFMTFKKITVQCHGNKCFKNVCKEKGKKYVKVFKCLHCPYTRETIVGIKKHLNFHITKSVYKCQYCSYSVWSQKGLNKHLICHEENGIVPMYKCHFCNYRTRFTESFKDHVRNHRYNLLKCYNCSYSTPLKSCMIRHQQNNHLMDKKGSLKCNSCEFRADKPHKLKRHRLTHKKPEDISYLHKCQFCPFKNPRKDCVKRHEENHRAHQPGEKCPFCTYRGLLFKHLPLHKEHLSPQESVQMTALKKCPHCPYKTWKSSTFKRHCLTHNKSTGDGRETNIFSCMECPYKTCRRYAFTEHLSKHQSTKGMKCPYCTYTSTHVTDAHIRLHNKK